RGAILEDQRVRERVSGYFGFVVVRLRPTHGQNRAHENASTQNDSCFHVLHLDQPARLRASVLPTSAPPRRLLSSAASMNANNSTVSSGGTGATPVLKTSMLATTSGR